jgi:serine/threonine protein kinase
MPAMPEAAQDTVWTTITPTAGGISGDMAETRIYVMSDGPGRRPRSCRQCDFAGTSLLFRGQPAVTNQDFVMDVVVQAIIPLTMPLTAGTKLDGYEVLGLLGAGGMGEVYRARDSVLKREVAIKVLPSFVSQDPDRLRRFEREAQAAAALNHPNILGVHRFGTFEGTPYLVSELLEGETLRQQMERGSLPVRKAIDYGVQIAHGLAAAHDKGIVHRDLKPENLFVTRNGRIKILDFGLAKLTQRQEDTDPFGPTGTHGTESGVVMGTVGYMAPEQVRGKTADHRADIFAFGAILYEMLAGKRAFQRSTSADTMSAILNEDPPGISQIVRSIPLGLQRVVHRCLEKNPEQRFQSASDLAFALDALSDSGSSSGATVAAPVQRWPQRALVWSTGLLAVLTLAAGVHYFMTRQGKALFEHYSIQKVIDSEHVRMTAISPDGNYLAAVVSDTNGTQSLVLHHVPTNSERPIVQDAAYRYQDVIFSPDGSYIYFRIHLLTLPDPDRLDVYRIPVLGGQPTRVLEAVDLPLSFIDGGQLVCFYRMDFTGGTYQFLSANPEGGDEQVLANRKKPFLFSGACAPNGRFAVLADTLGNVESLDFASGSKHTLASATSLGGFSNLHWSPSGKGLYVIGGTPRRPNAQIGFLSYPGLNLRPITNDLGNYSGISLTADATTIATTQSDRNTRFGELSLAEHSHLQEHQAGKLSWFTWVDNNKIVVSDWGSDLRVVNLINNETTAISVAKEHFYSHPALCGSDTLVVSGGTLDGDKVSVYKMHLDGSGLTQLTKGLADLFPACSGDGKWLYYADNREVSDVHIMRQPLEGGAAQSVVGANVWYDRSSDGKLLAVVTIVDSRVEIVSTDSRQAIRTLQVPSGFRYEIIAFSADNKSVFYTTRAGADTTIWRHPLDGATPVKVASLPGKLVRWIRPSPDGKKLGLVLDAPTSEAVLLRDVH